MGSTGLRSIFNQPAQDRARFANWHWWKHPDEEYSVRTFFEWYFSPNNYSSGTDYRKALIMANNLGIDPPLAESDFRVGNVASLFAAAASGQKGLDLLEFLETQSLLAGKVDSFEKISDLIALLNDKGKGYGFSLPQVLEEVFNDRLAEAIKLKEEKAAARLEVPYEPKAREADLVPSKPRPNPDRRKRPLNAPTSRVHTKKVNPDDVLRRKATLAITDDVKRTGRVGKPLNDLFLFVPDYETGLEPLFVVAGKNTEARALALHFDRYVHDHGLDPSNAKENFLAWLGQLKDAEKHIADMGRLNLVRLYIIQNIGRDENGKTVRKYPYFERPSKKAFNEALGLPTKPQPPIQREAKRSARMISGRSAPLKISPDAKLCCYRSIVNLDAPVSENNVMYVEPVVFKTVSRVCTGKGSTIGISGTHGSTGTEHAAYGKSTIPFLREDLHAKDLLGPEKGLDWRNRQRKSAWRQGITLIVMRPS